MFKLNIISVYSFIESTIWDAQGLAWEAFGKWSIRGVWRRANPWIITDAGLQLHFSSTAWRGLWLLGQRHWQMEWHGEWTAGMGKKMTCGIIVDFCFLKKNSFILARWFGHHGSNDYFRPRERCGLHHAVHEFRWLLDLSNLNRFQIQNFPISGISILYRKPTKEPPSLFSFMSPFSQQVWLYLGAAYLGVSFCLFVLGRLSPAEWDNPYPCIEEPEVLENQFSLKNSLWFTIGALLQQGSELAPKYDSIRLAGIQRL